MLGSKHHPTKKKKNWGLEKWVIPDFHRKKYKIRLEHFEVQENAQKVRETCQEDSQKGS